jgi:hypothetical protein
MLIKDVRRLKEVRFFIADVEYDSENWWWK